MTTDTLGYRAEGETYCNDCFREHIETCFPNGDKTAIQEYIEGMCTPLLSDDADEYGDQVYEETCGKCGEKIYESVGA
ncbi:hypothetical protein IMZ31_23945 (plasmid) [Pontibacillus sp. ALD_SL1]|uniref:hypothetical protein n=1 Tax=Pontibacillus sp. ALD_SL1 TaxID=2777185 RepID=UPI001A96B916|nr:hypothetical protein [Pontibacillus sp. ALD_SL1]QST02506.1 hypothetical protein IMZ31_23945 [Pontibacillus sp. ALD_SL1]